MEYEVTFISLLYDFTQVKILKNLQENPSENPQSIFFYLTTRH